MFQTEINATKIEVLKLVVEAHRGLGIDPGHTNEIANDLTRVVTDKIEAYGRGDEFPLTCNVINAWSRRRIADLLRDWDADGSTLRFAGVDYVALLYSIVPYAIKLVALEDAEAAMRIANGWATKPRKLAA